jgi:hypothetical protein
MFAKILTATLIGLTSLSAASAAFAAPPQRNQVREARQETRIVRGVVNGDLTALETAVLVSEQRHIDRMQRRARADDGRVGPVERARIENAQDRASGHIYTLKHNRRAR